MRRGLGLGRLRGAGAGVMRGAGAAPWYLAGGIVKSACVGAYRAIGAASQAASYVNLITPGTLNLTTAAAPTWAAATGWTFNGTSHYLETGIAPSNAYSYLIRFSAVTNTGVIFGEQETNKFVSFSPDRNSGSPRYYFAALTANVAPVMLSGVAGCAGYHRYRNGAADGDFVDASFTSVQTCTIGATKTNAGLIATYCACVVEAVAVYNAILTPAQIAAVTTAMRNLT